MRQDMYKVIVERPRRGGYGYDGDRHISKQKLRNLAATDYDDEELDLGRTDRPLKTKELNENLAPLVRFLRKSVGRPWDEVYSELRENLRMDSAVQYHVVQHLRYFVHLDVVMGDDGHIYREYGSWFYNEQALDLPSKYFRAQDVFYVHPETKILCVAVAKGKKEHKQEDERKKLYAHVQVNKFLQLRHINGSWKAVELAEIPTTNKDGFAMVYDRVRGLNMEVRNYKMSDMLFPDGLSAEKRYKEYDSYSLYAISVRDLGRREQEILKNRLKERE